jgi:ketosteroid isomerase-like protein
MKRLFMLSSIAVVFSVFAFGCQQKAAQKAPAPADSTKVVAAAQPNIAEIKTMLEKAQQDYAMAWCNKDTTFIANNWAHDDDITIWGPAETALVKGWEGPNGVKNWYWSAFDAAKTINFTMSDVLVKVAQDGNSAVITYNVHNEVTDLKGKKSVMTPRVTVVKERDRKSVV